jgi:hypothetical protein
MRKGENGIMFTDPTFTPETRAVAAIIPPDDSNDGDNGARVKPRFATDFREDDADDGFLKWNLWLRDNLLDERQFILDVANEFIAKNLEQRDALIRSLEITIAELKGEIKRLTENQRGPAGPRGERGLRGLAGRQGPKGKAGSDAKAPRIRTWWIQPEKFCAVPVLSDGSHGPALDIRPFFLEFQKQTT